MDSFPNLFGQGTLFGGSDGVKWMLQYPYALPNLLCSILLFAEAAAVMLFLRETLPSQKHSPGLITYLVHMAKGVLSILKPNKLHGYNLLENGHDLAMHEKEIPNASDMSPIIETVSEKDPSAKPPQRLPFHRIWTSNVLFTLLSIAIFDFHMGYVFISSVTLF